MTDFGDPSDDLNFATVIFLIEGRLVLLRPRRVSYQAERDTIRQLTELLSGHPRRSQV